jgi:hypothetical protein
MLAHAEVVVGTPDGHLVLQAVIEGLRKAAGAPLEVGKDPISIFASYELETWLKQLIEIHRFLSCRSVREKSNGRSRWTILREN